MAEVLPALRTRLEQEVGLGRSGVQRALVEGRRRVVRHVSGRAGAVVRHVQVAVGVPHQVVGVANAGGVDRHQRAWGKGIVKPVDRAVRVALGLRRRLLARLAGIGVDHVGLDVIGIGTSIDQGCDRIMVDFEHSRGEQPLVPVAPHAIGSTRGGVAALDDEHLTGGIEFDAVGEVVAGRPRQAGHHGRDRPIELRGDWVKLHPHDLAGEVRRVAYTCVAGQPEIVRAVGIEGDSDHRASVEADKGLLVRQSPIGWIDIPAVERSHNGGCVELRPVGRELEAGHRDVLNGRLIVDDERRIERLSAAALPSAEGDGEVLQQAAVQVLHTNDDDLILGVRVQRLQRRDRQRVVAA